MESGWLPMFYVAIRYFRQSLYVPIISATEIAFALSILCEIDSALAYNFIIV